MRRVALALVFALVAPLAHAEEPPPWMPSPPPPPSRQAEREIKRLRHEATAFSAVGIVLFAGGIAVNVVALDVPQSERLVKQPDGTSMTQHVLGDANWAELAGGLALMATGFALVSLGMYRLKQAHRLEAAR